MTKIILYYNGSSKNHGCEAINRSVCDIFKNNNCSVYSFYKDDDILFELNKVLEIKELGIQHTRMSNKKKNIIKKILPKTIFNLLKLMRNKFIIRYKSVDLNKIAEQFKNLLEDDAELFLSVGGDNYCYGEYDTLSFLNKSLTEKNKKTVLLGSSIEPSRIEKDTVLREDLKKYSLITARESLTYNALINAGINKNTHLIPDPAFVLDKIVPLNLPKEFIKENTVGINISPLVQNLEKCGNITYKNIITLIEYILKDTNMNIVFIPHVTWANNNDLELLTKLYNKFKKTNRVCLIGEKYNCMELKGIISQCRFLVAARTHASIAGYSSQVPTLVIGYSVKAKGIAKDIFGDYKNYVLSVQNLKYNNEITNAFKFLMDSETAIREHYKNFMPSYIEKVWQAKDLVEKLQN